MLMMMDGKGFKVEEALGEKGKGEEKEGGDELWLPHDMMVVAVAMLLLCV